MGIFGFLSKAHLDQAVPAGDISSQVQIFDDKIKTERDNIEAARKALKQMDAQVDEKLSRTTDDRGAERAVQIRRAQSKERTNLQNEISSAQKKISALQEQRAPIASQARKVEAEVGPIKYIAALIYGDNPDANLLEKAVRWVIILIVLVFDPLALVLILAADQTFTWHRPKRRDDWEQVWQPVSENPWHDEPVSKKPTEIKEDVNVPILEGEETQAQRLIDEAEAKNSTLTRELEAVKAIAENLKKKLVSWIKDPLKKKS
jgi:cell division septum initiation protein DivIVA